MDRPVTLVVPLALLPVILVVLHLSALVVVAGIIQGVLETAAAALAHTVRAQGDQDDGADGCGTAVDADVGAYGESGPFLCQALWRVGDGVLRRGVSAAQGMLVRVAQ